MKKWKIKYIVCLLLLLTILTLSTATVKADEGLGDIFWNALFCPIKNVIDSLLGVIHAALVYIPNLDTPAVRDTWSIAHGICLSAIGIAIAGIGIMYILAPIAEQKYKYKHLLTKFIFALILGASSILIGNFAIALASDLTDVFMAEVSIGSMNPVALVSAVTHPPGSPAGGFFDVILLIPAVILVLGVLILNAIRILIVLFTGALLPWGFLLWSFPVTENYGKRMIVIFFEWTFLSVFQAVVLKIGIGLSNDYHLNNPLLQLVLFYGVFGLCLAMPKLMSTTGHGVVSTVERSMLMPMSVGTTIAMLPLKGGPMLVKGATAISKVATIGGATLKSMPAKISAIRIGKMPSFMQRR
ncbi:MAG: hypothetical protein QW620_06535 [Thermoplasmata archaeon]